MKKIIQTIAGLDIGTSQVRVIIAKPTENGIEVIGVGASNNTGVRRGIVVNIESTAEAIKKAREEAELMAGLQIKDVYVGVAGTHIRSFDSRGMVPIKNKEVTKMDIARVIDAAKAVAVPAEQEVLHVLPTEYKIDEQDGITDPIGMSGVRLECSVHIVTGGQNVLSNIRKCAEKAGLKIKGFVLAQLASSLAVLSDDERKLGAVLVDLGAGSTDTIIYVQGSVAYTSVIPVSGWHLTNDIAVGLRTPQAFAEELKKKHGCALASLINGSEAIEVLGVGGRKSRTVLRQYLCEILEPRVEEILNFVNTEIQKSGLSQLVGSGVVLTGGASQLEGLCEMGEFVFDMPVRVGLPVNFSGLSDIIQSPAYATANGIIKYAFEQMFTQNEKPRPVQVVGQWFDRVRELVDQAL